MYNLKKNLNRPPTWSVNLIPKNSQDDSQYTYEEEEFLRKIPPSSAYIGKMKMKEAYKKKFTDYTLISDIKKRDGV